MKGVVGLMRASSATGRGTARTSRRPAKVVRIPTANAVRRKRTLRLAVAIFAAVVAAALSTRLGFIRKRPVGTAQPIAQLSSAESRIVELVNAERKRSGAAPLTLSERLMLASRTHSQDMAVRGYLGHDSADDTTADRVRAAGLDYEELAENLYNDRSSGLGELPEHALMNWLASPAPRGNLLSPRFRTTAVAIARAADGTLYVTLDLMR